MIKIIFHRNDDKKISFLESEGHANFDKKGKDIVCSAVSSVLVGGINSLQNIDSYDIKINEGYIKLDTKNINSEYDAIVLETIYVQLKTIEKSYSQYVKVIEKD